MSIVEDWRTVGDKVICNRIIDDAFLETSLNDSLLWLVENVVSRNWTDECRSVIGDFSK